MCRTQSLIGVENSLESVLFTMDAYPIKLLNATLRKSLMFFILLG